MAYYAGRQGIIVKLALILTLVSVPLMAWSVTARGDPAVSPEAILEDMETYGEKVKDLRCAVVMREDDLITDDVTKREGEIRFKRKDPNPAFMVSFTKTVQDGEVIRKKSWYLFDGRFFFEALERSKSIIKRDVAPPGKTIDLFSIENAPFPMPFGQKKAEILKHFNVRLGPPNGDGPPDADHLICTPKPKSRLAKDYSKLEFFVSRTLHLPIRIVMTTNPPDKIITADFPDLSAGSINTGLKDSMFKLPSETKRYSVVEE